MIMFMVIKIRKFFVRKFYQCKSSFYARKLYSVKTSEEEGKRVLQKWGECYDKIIANL